MRLVPTSRPTEGTCFFSFFIGLILFLRVPDIVPEFASPHGRRQTAPRRSRPKAFFRSIHTDPQTFPGVLEICGIRREPEFGDAGKCAFVVIWKPHFTKRELPGPIRMPADFHVSRIHADLRVGDAVFGRNAIAAPQHFCQDPAGVELRRTEGLLVRASNATPRKAWLRFRHRLPFHAHAEFPAWSAESASSTTRKTRPNRSIT